MPLHPLRTTVVVALCVLANACRLELMTGVPQFNLSRSGGCGDIFVYKTSSNEREVVVVSANVRQFSSQTNPLVYDLRNPPAGLEVRVDMYPTRPSSMPYCNDVIIASDPQPTRWVATQGTVTITLEHPPTGQMTPYRAVVRLENAVFENGRGRRVGQGEPIVIDATVGWYAG